MPREPEETQRLFIAIPAPPAVRRWAAEVISTLRGPGEVRWVAPELLHLTLKFLGETPAGLVPKIAENLAEKANEFSRIVVELGRVGAFPNLRRPQTLWLGIEGQETGMLTALTAGIERALLPLGIPKEGKAFKPHLTIGRVKGPRGLAELSRALVREAERDAAQIEWWVEEFTLVRSVLRPAGPEYTSLYHFPLAGAAIERNESQQ